MSPTILIVDDENSIVEALSGLLADEDFDVVTASNGYEAMQQIHTASPDLVLLDIWMPGMDGIETLKAIKKDSPYLQVIMITGHGTIETAVQATKLGAYDFIEKPLTFDKVVVAIQNALNYRRVMEENQYLRKKTLEKNAITGNSPAVQQLLSEVSIAAGSDSRVLITGEDGVGKELVARTIHYLGKRAEAPLVDINCAAIPDSLIEVELFGHEKGVLPEAAGKKRGKFEVASKGTLFLDEIGDMSPSGQAALLRVLEEKQFQRIGGNRMLDVECRIISASNKNLDEEIEKGAFRKDLLHRLKVLPITVPPLRHRSEDIPLLVETFLKENAQDQAPPKTISGPALEILCHHPWPGNVRELKNLVERLAIMVKRSKINVTDLPAPYHPDPPGPPLETIDLFEMDDLKDARRQFEKRFIQCKLDHYDQNITHTAKAIGVDRSYLHRLIKGMKS